MAGVSRFLSVIVIVQSISLAASASSAQLLDVTLSDRIQPEDLLRIQSIENLTTSSDGSVLAFATQTVDVAKNRHYISWHISEEKSDWVPQVVSEFWNVQQRKNRAGFYTGRLIGTFGELSADGSKLYWIEQAIQNLVVKETDVVSLRTRQLAEIAGHFLKAEVAGDETSICVESIQQQSQNDSESPPVDTTQINLLDIVAPMAGLAISTAQRPHRVSWLVSLQSPYAVERMPGACGSENDPAKLDDSFPGANDPTRASGAISPDLEWVSWTRPQHEDMLGPLPMRELYAKKLDGSANPLACLDSICRGMISDYFWGVGSDLLFLLTSTGANYSETSLVSWSPKKNVTSIVHTTTAKLSKCRIAPRALICVREGTKEPPHIVAIDLDNGKFKSLVDPNNTIAAKLKNEVVRIEWTVPFVENPLGFTDRQFGYIVYPSDYDPEQTYPVFISPYSARGFFKGDVGDEHPLFVYADAGFIVLNLDYPKQYGDLARISDPRYISRRAYGPELNSALYDFTLLSNDIAIRILSEQASIDKDRIAMGGVSHGAQITAYTMHKRDFLSAAILGSHVWEPMGYFFQGSLMRSRDYGPFPAPTDVGSSFWNGFALSRNVDNIEAALLMNLPESETLLMLPTMRKLTEGKKAFDAYVYLQENHYKQIPSNRLAIYRLNLQWLNFWLRSIEDPEPMDVGQYSRWRKMRAEHCDALEVNGHGKLPSYCDEA